MKSYLLNFEMMTGRAYFLEMFMILPKPKLVT